jgi:hypothetical protein
MSAQKREKKWKSAIFFGELEKWGSKGEVLGLSTADGVVLGRIGGFDLKSCQLIN